jgi:hypothetical protein
MSKTIFEKPVEVLSKIVKLMNTSDEEVQVKQHGKSNGVIIEDDEVVGSNKKRLLPHLKKFINHQELQSYKLSYKDAMAVTILWQKYLKYRFGGMSWDDLCDEIDLDTSDINCCFAFIESLIKRKIARFEKTSGRIKSLDFMRIIANDLVLRKDFVLKILGRDIVKEIDEKLPPGWDSDRNLFSDLFPAISLIFESYAECDDITSFNPRRHTFEVESLNQCVKLFTRRFKRKRKIPELIRAYYLAEMESLELTLLLLVAYFEVYEKEETSEEELLDLLSKNDKERLLYANYLRPDSKLISYGFLQFREGGLYSLSDRLKLNGKFKNCLMTGSSEWELNCLKALDKSLSSINLRNNHMTIIDSDQKITDLIMDDAEKGFLKTFIARQKNRSDHDLSKWGVKSNGTESDNRHKGFIALFYGESGTGKTFAAGAVANELGRELVSIDCTELRDKYYGESEKIVKKTFSDMTDIARGNNNSPVFLLNEADQIIHCRKSDLTNVDPTENAIQNIILESLESFEGILILTTNMLEIIDHAYFRRFNLKLHFKTPDEACRKKLWKLHLSDKIPGVEGICLDFLARTYSLTGGQIAMIVMNACSEAITRVGSARKLTMSDLVKYIQLELPYNSRSRSSNIGFAQEKTVKAKSNLLIK